MPETHGQQRVLRVTASMARTIMSGNQKAWETLAAKIWADDGSAFDSGEGSAACLYGKEHEAYAKGKFWLRHPEMDQAPVKFVKFKRHGYPDDHPYRRHVGCSPDLCLVWNHLETKRLAGGGEIKSPTTEATFRAYVADMVRGHVPREHVDQVRFSLWATGWPVWWFVTHYGEDSDDNYKELLVQNHNLAQQAWEREFLPRLDAFLKFAFEGEEPTRDKLGGDDLAALLGG